MQFFEDNARFSQDGLVCIHSSHACVIPGGGGAAHHPMAEMPKFSTQVRYLELCSGGWHSSDRLSCVLTGSRTDLAAGNDGGLRETTSCPEEIPWAQHCGVQVVRGRVHPDRVLLGLRRDHLHPSEGDRAGGQLHPLPPGQPGGRDVLPVAAEGGQHRRQLHQGQGVAQAGPALPAT